ncbi:MAG: hypothetical protein IT303_12420 [Dehalococcoidia bacterium]|nr:hypothetical protein [Dehalococcoidia bacterium]
MGPHTYPSSNAAAAVALPFESAAPAARSRPLIGGGARLSLLMLLWPAAAMAVCAVLAVRAGLRRARGLTLGLLAAAVVAGPVAVPVVDGVAVPAARTVALTPFTVPALAWGVANGGTVEVRGSMFVVTGMDSGWGPRAGVTVGQVFLTNKEEVSDVLLAHESTHADQWAALGVLLPALYAANDALTGAAADQNVFEVDAGLEAGGYYQE